MDHYFTNNENLKSEIKTLHYSYNNYDFLFMSDNGVFSNDHIDYGSRLLVETFLKSKPSPKNILDVGSGYGFIGIVLAKVLNVPVTMVDVNKRAVHLAKRNVENNKVQVDAMVSSAYDDVKEKYDVIITNPPVRAGKEVLLKILEGAKDYLNDNGSLWYVLRKDQGAKSMEKVLSKHYKIYNIAKSKGFYIFKCEKY